MLVLICDSKPFSTNKSLLSDFMVAILTRMTWKMVAPVKIQNNALNVASANELTSLRTAIHLIGFAPYNAKADILLARATTCIGTTFQRHVHTKDVI